MHINTIWSKELLQQLFEVISSKERKLSAYLETATIKNYFLQKKRLVSQGENQFQFIVSISMSHTKTPKAPYTRALCYTKFNKELLGLASNI